MFQCRRCGNCCTRMKHLPEGRMWQKLSAELDSGDGTCIYLDRTTRLCKIYYDRPNLCRNSWIYDNLLKDVITREEFDEILNRACNLLRGSTE